ncbi:MAG: ATP-binding cassette domain-containing protein [Cyanobacteria bacterium REEB67]|nr:ATP-binding cassette domain-containing protein [Cyanobacteria bacterium REEB67]
MNESQLHTYMRLLRYVKPYWLFFTFGLLAAIPSGGMDALQAWLAGTGLQKIFVEKHEHMIFYVPVAVIAIVTLSGLFRFIESYNIRHVGAAAIRDMRNELFSHLQQQPLLYYQNQSSGILIGRLINDVAIIEAAITQAFQSLISRTITVVSLVAVIFMQSWSLTLIAVSILSLIVVPVSIFGKKIRKSSRGGQEAIGNLVSVISESIQGAKVVQSFNLENYQVNRFKETNQTFFYNTIKAIKSESVLSPILAFISSLGIAAVIYVAGTMVVKHQMTLGSLTTFVISLLLLYSPIKNIGRINGIVQPALAAATRVFEVLDKKSDLTNCANPIELKAGTHRIKFDHVYFQYPNNDNMVLRDISLDVEPGKMIALVGLSGSGKSTMANLVPRFFDVTAGSIYIDGINIKELELTSLREQIAVVTQDNFLFNTTVAENIRLGNLKATKEEVEEAAKAAFCHDFIMELPEKYETMIGERGVRLSGGQQQRLAIARAFLKNAPLIIMDEATSSLDNESEAMVQEALNKLMEGRTVIVIAHRLSTVRHADQIYVLDHGQVLETGTHTELISQDATYARLIRAQFERPVS